MDEWDVQQVIEHRHSPEDRHRPRQPAAGAFGEGDQRERRTERHHQVELRRRILLLVERAQEAPAARR